MYEIQDTELQYKPNAGHEYLLTPERSHIVTKFFWICVDSAEVNTDVNVDDMATGFHVN